MIDISVVSIGVSDRGALCPAPPKKKKKNASVSNLGKIQEFWFPETKQFTRLLEHLHLYKQNPLEKFFGFTIYQNYTLALML